MATTTVTITGREHAAGGLVHLYGTILLADNDTTASVRTGLKTVHHASLSPKTEVAAATYVNLPHWSVSTEAAGTGVKVTWTFQDLGEDAYFSFEVVGTD